MVAQHLGHAQGVVHIGIYQRHGAVGDVLQTASTSRLLLLR